MTLSASTTRTAPPVPDGNFAPFLRGASRQALAVRLGELSALELVDSVIARIEDLNGQINALVTLDFERARLQAMRLDKLLHEGTVLGPLHGVPVTIKDTIETAGMRTTAGASVYANHVPAADATAVAALRRAGAIILGKSNVPKLAGDYQTYNSLFGVTRNPWDLAKTVGGSSGGSAAAVASSMSALDIGSDTAGSLTLPAHYCGVYSHKPTFGLVSTRGHIPPAPGGVSQRDIAVLGPIAREPDDLELALRVLRPQRRPRGRRPGEGRPPRRLDQFRVGAIWRDPAAPLDPDVEERIEAAVEALIAAGARVVPDAGPSVPLDESQAMCCQLVAAASSAVMSEDQFDFVASISGEFDPESRDAVALLARGTAMSHRRWLLLRERVAEFQLEWERFFASYDVLLCPISPVAAYEHDVLTPREERTLTIRGRARPYFDQLIWPSWVALGELPATAFPVGLTPSGLPVGMQVVGPKFGDALCLRFARLAQHVLGRVVPSTPAWPNSSLQTS